MNRFTDKINNVLQKIAFRIVILHFVFVLLNVYSCKPTQKSAKTSKENNSSVEKTSEGKPASVSVLLERTACFGTCPVYKLIIHPDGAADYEGHQHVTHIGKYTTTFTKEELKAIADKAESIHYFKLQDKYDSPITDFPSTITSITINGKTKTVTSRDQVPPELREFEIYLEKLFKEKALKKVVE